MPLYYFPMDTTKSLKWAGPILDCSGYAAAARGYLRAAEFNGIAIQARDKSRSINLKNIGMDAGLVEMYNRLYKTPVPNDAPSVQHQVPDAFYINNKTRCSIGYTIFEMTRIPQVWVDPCDSVDVIWTGSSYSKDSMLASGVRRPIEVLPHAIDIEAYSPHGTQWKIENRRAFAFLSVFDFTERKAWKDLLRGYWSAFDRKDDVCLILKVYYSDFSDQSRGDIIRKICDYRQELKMQKRAPILIYGHDISNSDMPSLYRSANCYVGMSREGFGLPYAEAMACGLPCIGPSVGGNREYMNESNSYLVDFVGNEPISQTMASMNPIFAGLEWAVHSWEHLANIMKQVVSGNDIKFKADAGLKDIRKNLNFGTIGERISAILP